MYVLNADRQQIDFAFDISNDRMIQITVSICQVQLPRSGTNKRTKMFLIIFGRL